VPSRATTRALVAGERTPDERADRLLELHTRKGNLLPEEVGMHPLRSPHEPHFVHLSWAVRRLTRTQAKYIRLFYGADMLATLEAL
jgi:hypothetical protein